MNFICVGFFKAESCSKSNMVEQVWDKVFLRSWFSLKSVGCAFTSDFAQWEHEHRQCYGRMRKKYLVSLETASVGWRRDSPTELSRFQWRLGRAENRKFLLLEYIHYPFCKLACRVSVLSWMYVAFIIVQGRVFQWTVIVSVWPLPCLVCLPSVLW